MRHIFIVTPCVVMMSVYEKSVIRLSFVTLSREPLLKGKTQYG
jgi:hypothetical protein